MIERTLIGAAAILAAVYAFVPREGDDAALPAPSEDRAQMASLDAGGTTAPGWGGTDRTLKRSADGHFYADAWVNGAETQFLVDTGASVVALTRADAEAMGLTWFDDEVRPIGTGASGAVHGVPVTLDTIEVAGHEAHNVQAVIIPEGLEVSLLGQSFLSTIGNVNIQGDDMVLGN